MATDDNKDFSDVYESAKTAIEKFETSRKDFMLAKENIEKQSEKISETILQLQKIQEEINALLVSENSPVNDGTDSNDDRSKDSDKVTKEKNIEENSDIVDSQDTSIKKNDESGIQSKSSTKQNQASTIKDTTVKKSPTKKIIAEKKKDHDKDDPDISKSKKSNIESFLTDDGLFDSDDIDEIHF